MFFTNLLTLSIPTKGLVSKIEKIFNPLQQLRDNNPYLKIYIAKFKYPISFFKKQTKKTGETKALIGLPIDSHSRKEKMVDKIIEVLYLYVNRAISTKTKQPQYPYSCGSNSILDIADEKRHYKKSSQKIVDICIEIGRQDILFNNLYSLICCDELFEGYFFESLEDHILKNNLNLIQPVILQNFIEYYAKNPQLNANLERCILTFEIENLDLHNLILKK